MAWLLLGLLVLWAVPARAAYMVPGAPYRPKDFAVVKKDGYYHVFFILNKAGTTFSSNELDLGHQVSPDLYHWTALPNVMHSEPTSWNNSHVWAPCIVYRDGLYWMLYTGTTYIAGQYNDTQRMGLAVSTDLMTWNRVETPVFSATQVPWTWVDSLNAYPAFRDPFVMADPSTPGSWLMYYTASYGPDSLADVIGVARSSGDFTQWSDVGPLLVTWRGYTYNQVTESPHLIQHNGLWYLFLTTSSGQPLSIYTATNPLADLWGWTYRGRMRSMLGYDVSTWFASEAFRDGTHDFFACSSGDRLEFREIEWGSSWSFSLVQPPYYRVTGLEWTAPNATEGDTMGLVLGSANWKSGGPTLRTFQLDAAGHETEVVPESLGLASQPELGSEQDTLWWTAHRWPTVPITDTTTVMRLRVRAADSTAVSGVLTVRAPALRDTMPGTPIDPPEEPIRLPILRTIAHSPLGDAPAAVVEMAAAASARLDLFDVQGRHVRTLASGELPAGVSVLAWDGRGDDGVSRPRGVYFARLVSGRAVRTARLLLLPR